MGQLIHLVFLQVPVFSARLIAVAVFELGGVRRTQKVRDRVAVFFLDSAQRQDAMQCGAKAFVRKEPQGIADVDDSMAWSRFDVFPGSVIGREDLEAPLRRVKDGEGTDVSVHILANLARVLSTVRVVKEVKGALGAAVVTVVGLQASVSFEA